MTSGRSPSTSTSRSRRRTTRPCGRSTPPRSPRAKRTTAVPASAPSTTRATTARSSWTPTGTTSRSSTTTAEPWPTTSLAASLLPAVDELGRRRVDVIGVRGAQEVPAALDDAKLRAGAVHEERHLLFGIDDGVDRVFGAVHPQDRATHAVEPAVQAVAVTQVDGADPDTLPPRIAGVVLLVCGVPEGALLGRHVLAQALLEDGVDELDRDNPVLTDGLGECVDGRRAELDAVPAPQIATALALEVHRGAERDDALHGAGGEDGHAGRYPSALRRAQDERLGDTERVEDLQVGDGRVPVGELLVRGAALAVTVRLDGEQVGGGDELLIRELGPVLLDRGGERVDHHQRGKRRVVGLAELVADGRGAEVGHRHRLCIAHDLSRSQNRRTADRLQRRRPRSWLSR